MNEIVNKVLLARGKSIFGMCFRKPGCTYSTCRLFTKIKDRRHKFKEIANVIFLNNFFLVLIGVSVFLKIMHCFGLKMLTEW